MDTCATREGYGEDEESEEGGQEEQALGEFLEVGVCRSAPFGGEHGGVGSLPDVVDIACPPLLGSLLFGGSAQQGVIFDLEV